MRLSILVASTALVIVSIAAPVACKHFDCHDLKNCELPGQGGAGGGEGAGRAEAPRS
jgi:hypothetical protein